MTWETVPLGDVVELRAGVTFPPALQGRIAGQYPFAKVGDIAEASRTGGEMVAARNYVDDADLQALRAKPLPARSTLFAKIGESLRLNARAYTLVPVLIDNNTMAAVPGKQVEPRYVFRFLQSIDLGSIASATSVPSLRKSDLIKWPIPLPPLPEQRRIAAILDEADALRSARHASLRLLRAVPGEVLAARDSRGWKSVSLGDVASLQGGLTVSARRATLPRRAGYLRVANVFRGAIDLTEIKDLGVTQAELERTRIRLGDLLVVEGHGNLDEVGRAALVTELPSADLTHQNHLFRLRPNAERVLGRFLELVLNSSDSREYFRRVANTTSGLNTLNATSVRSLRMRLAPPAIQDEVVREVDGVSNSIRAAERSSAQLDELFASLQHRAFRGEL